MIQDYQTRDQNKQGIGIYSKTATEQGAVLQREHYQNFLRESENARRRNKGETINIRRNSIFSRGERESATFGGKKGRFRLLFHPPEQ